MEFGDGPVADRVEVELPAEALPPEVELPEPEPEPETAAPPPAPEPEQAKPEPRRRAEERIARLVAQRSEERRLREAAEARAAELEARLAKVEPAAYRTGESEIGHRIAAAERKAVELFESGDTAGFVRAQAELAELSTQRGRVKETAQRAEQYWQTATQQRQQPAQEPPQLAVQWRVKNDQWFQSDPEMANAALEIEQQVRQAGWLDSDPEYYEELDDKLAARFPAERFGRRNEPVAQRPSPAPAQSPVAPVGRPAPAPQSTGRRKVSLSPEQVRQAQRWGISPQAYAESLIRGGVME